MAFAPILMAAGTLFGGVAALGQGLYQSQVAKNNAVIAEQNANAASEQAQLQQMRSDREYAAQRGTYLAETGASGVNLGSGSAQDILGLINRNQREAATDLRRQGEAQSTDFNNQSAAYKGQAAAAKSAGISSLVGSVLKAGGQLGKAYGGKDSENSLASKKRSYPANWSNG